MSYEVPNCYNCGAPNGMYIWEGRLLLCKECKADPAVRKHYNVEKRGCCVVWKGLVPPDDPRYKEGWTITVQPSEEEIQKALAKLKAEGKWPPKRKPQLPIPKPLKKSKRSKRDTK
jgi:hypothetical protein